MLSVVYRYLIDQSANISILNRLHTNLTASASLSKLYSMLCMQIDILMIDNDSREFTFDIMQLSITARNNM